MPLLALKKSAPPRGPLKSTGVRVEYTLRDRARKRMHDERKLVQQIREALAELSATSEKVRLIKQIDEGLAELRIQIGVDQFVAEYQTECGVAPDWAALQEARDWADPQD